MDWSVVIIQVAKLVGYAFPFSLIFGVTAKLVNMTLDMIFNKKIEMQEDKKMMNGGIFSIICIVMLVVGLLSNVLAWILKRVYKNKMNSMANLKKAEKQKNDLLFCVLRKQPHKSSFNLGGEKYVKFTRTRICKINNKYLF